MLFALVAFVLLARWATPSAASVIAKVDKSAVAFDEPVELELEVTGDPGARPDLSVLTTDFDIIDRRTSHSVSVLNGVRSESHRLVLRLLPRRAGKLTVPAIPFGDTTTEPLKLTVAAGPTATSDEFVTDPAPAVGSEGTPAVAVALEASLEPDRVYTRQQLVLTVKVFMDGPVQRPQLHDPQIRDADILPLGEDHSETRRDGQSNRVYERRYAIFPRVPGRMEIDPLLFEGWAPVAGGVRPGTGFAPPEHQLHARSPALAAEVLSPAAGIDPERWLPARRLSLRESGPETYHVSRGQPIERRISLRAEGIMASRLPQLAVDVPHELTVRYGQPSLWDERRPEGVIGTRQQVITLTVDEPGRFRLPPLTLDWWNTHAAKWETAMLPARELVVTAGPQTDSVDPQRVTGVDSEPGRQGPSPAASGDIEDKTTDTHESRGDESSASDDFWTWIAVALGLAWIATMAAWWRSRRRATAVSPAAVPAEPMPAREEADPLQSEIDAVRTAYESGDAGAAREALLTWARQALPGQPPSNLARLAQRCMEPLRGQVLLLEEAFFSPGPVAWDEKPVWEGLRGFVPAPPEEPATHRRGRPIRRRAPNPDAE